jgi:hypothetical protein
MEKLLIKNRRDTVTFEVEGSFKVLENLLNKLLNSGDSIDLEIDELPSIPSRFIESADKRVKIEEAYISLSCTKSRYYDVEKYINDFLIL